MSRRSLQSRIQGLLNQWREAPTMMEAAKCAAKAWVFLQRLKDLPKEPEFEMEPTRREKTALPDHYDDIALRPTVKATEVFQTLKGQPYTPQPPAVHTHITKPGFTLWDNGDNDPEDEWDR